MFGYVIPDKGELKVREFEIFKAYYCGLCHEIGRISQFSRLTLTYDMTFTALLLSSVFKESEEGEMHFCPFKMRNMLTINSNEYLLYAAELNIILANRKLLDNYNDERNILSLVGSKLINISELSSMTGEKVDFIDRQLKVLGEYEKKHCSNIDQVADPFALLTAEIFRIGEGNVSDILMQIGYNLGKWIYLIDAYDDMEEDLGSGSYNAVLCGFEHNGEELESFRQKIDPNIRFTLTRCLAEIAEGCKQLSFKKNSGIIENIVYLGLDRRMSQVFERRAYNAKSIRGSRSQGICLRGGNKAGL